MDTVIQEFVEQVSRVCRRENHRLLQELRSGRPRGFSRWPVLSPSQWPPLPEDTARIWELLKGRAMQAKEIAVKLYGHPRHEGAVRKAVLRIRQSGRPVELTPGVGYWRPDNPPPGVGLAALGE